MCHSRMKKKDEGKGKTSSSNSGEYFPLRCTKSYCVARGKDEKYMSGERIIHQQPAPVRALLKYTFHTAKGCLCLLFILCAKGGDTKNS